MTDAPDGRMEQNATAPRHRRWGLICGALIFLFIVATPPPPGLAIEGWRTAAVAFLMAIWWMTEAIPIPATALIPLVLFPLLGVLEMPDATAPFANELIFLFMGGFFIAAAMERWNLHRRIALAVTRQVGTSPPRLIFGFMLATAFLSMWISNTATAAMMFPIALAVAQMLKPATEGPYRFGIGLMLSVAYSASIGGAATLIGTPPNAVLAGAASELLGIRIGFLEWMIVAVPVTAVFLPVGWLLLTRVLYRPEDLVGDASVILEEEWRKLGPISPGERRVGIIFVLTVLAWLFRSEKTIGELTIPGIQSLAPSVTDATIAMTAALLLFTLPINFRKGQFTLDWASARKIPWGVLVLFGGGLSLARGMDQSGLAAWIGGAVSAFGGAPTVILVAAIAVLFVFLTEITSNLATATMAMPVLAGAAAGLGLAPLPLMATAALASSMAFMLPVATPPNAIVFGSEYITIPQMVRAGLWMNLISIILVTLIAITLLPFVFG